MTDVFVVDVENINSGKVSHITQRASTDEEAVELVMRCIGAEWDALTVRPVDERDA